MLTKEQLAFRRKWIRALRSGKYQQAREQLREDGAFCCLGVACDISKQGKWLANDAYLVGDNARTGFMPRPIKNMVGLTELEETSLSNLNDSGSTFIEIADTLELLTLADMDA